MGPLDEDRQCSGGRLRVGYAVRRLPTPLQFGSNNPVIHFARPFPTAPAVSRAVRDQWLVHGRCADEDQRFTSRDHNGCDKNQYSVTGHIRLLVVGQ